MNITQTLIPGPTTAGSGAQKSDRSAGTFGAKLDDAITSRSTPANPDNQEARPHDAGPGPADNRRNDAGPAEPSSGGTPDVMYGTAVSADGASAELAPGVLRQASAEGLPSTVPAGDSAALTAAGTEAVSDVDSAREGGSRLPASPSGAVPAAQHAVRPHMLAIEGEAVFRSSGTARGLSTAAGTATVAGAALDSGAPGMTVPATAVMSGTSGTPETSAPTAPGMDQGTPLVAGEESPALPADAAGPFAGGQSTADAALQAGARQTTDAPSPAPSGMPPVEASRSGQLSQPAQMAPSSSPAAAAPPPPPLHSQLAAPIFSLTAAGRGEHTMTLSVTPDDFGPVTVRAHIGTEGVRIELFAGNDAGREALRAILQELKRDLAGSGLNASLDLSQHDRPGERDGKPPEYGHGSANQTHLSSRQLTSAAYNIRQAESASTDAGLDVMA